MRPTVGFLTLSRFPSFDSPGSCCSDLGNTGESGALSRDKQKVSLYTANRIIRDKQHIAATNHINKTVLTLKITSADFF